LTPSIILFFLCTRIASGVTSGDGVAGDLDAFERFDVFDDLDDFGRFDDFDDFERFDAFDDFDDFERFDVFDDFERLGDFEDLDVFERLVDFERFDVFEVLRALGLEEVSFPMSSTSLTTIQQGKDIDSTTTAKPR